MKTFLMILLCFCAFACTTDTKNTAPNLLWHFNAKQNNAQMDHQLQPILTGYQELLRGVANKDTLYIKETSTGLVKLADSLTGLKLATDTLLQNNWVNGLVNISAELQGVMISNSEQDFKELTMSMNMTAVQILKLLSDIGYKEHNVYIFNAASEFIEDGVYWLSLQKSTKNPFSKSNKEDIQAQGILQEMK
jgi:hypothetical protein